MGCERRETRLAHLTGIARLRALLRQWLRQYDELEREARCWKRESKVDVERFTKGSRGAGFTLVRCGAARRLSRSLSRI